MREHLDDGVRSYDSCHLFFQCTNFDIVSRLSDAEPMDIQKLLENQWPPNLATLYKMANDFVKAGIALFADASPHVYADGPVENVSWRTVFTDLWESTPAPIADNTLLDIKNTYAFMARLNLNLARLRSESLRADDLRTHTANIKKMMLMQCATTQSNRLVLTQKGYVALAPKGTRV
jgi:hypothetical protein